MALIESRFMPSGPILAGLLAVVGAILVVAGFLMEGTCGGGYSLLLYGLAVILFGGSAASVGGFTALIVAGIFGVALIGIGLFTTHGACSYPF
jgi:hypothetical protein